MLVSNWISKWFLPQDNSPLVLFRAFFGLLLFLEAAGAIATGWVYETMVEPTFTFSFIGFEWLQPLPGNGMYFYFAVMALFGLGVMLGYRYRVAVAGYTLLWAGAYFMQKSNYNNHYYLLLLLLLLMNLVPAHRAFSLDVRQGRVEKSLTCPRWCTGIFVAELAIVYFFAAMAKLYPDWLAGKPVGLWMSRKADWPLIGPLLASEAMKWALVYGGLFFDLLVVPMLLWKPTRKFAVGVSFLFHGFNSGIFQIGIFPYLMMGSLVLFYPPDTIRRWFFRKRAALSLSDQSIRYSQSKPLIAVLGVWFLIQIALPLRHWFFEGNVHWTEEGHRLSWHMMTRSKGGSIRFQVKNPQTGAIRNLNSADYLTHEQEKALSTRPDMIWQFAQRLESAWQDSGWVEVEVYAKSYARLNGRTVQQFVDPNVDLAAEEWHRFQHKTWILPIVE